MGRPSLAPGRHFRLLLLGYFEGLDSERAIAWRATDSLSLRAFLHLVPPAASPGPFDDRPVRSKRLTVLVLSSCGDLLGRAKSALVGNAATGG